MPMCVHGEVTDHDIDIFDREAVFIDRVLDPLRAATPGLRVVKVEAVVRSTGYGKRAIPVTLSTGGRVVRQKWVELAEGVNETKVAFEFTPPRAYTVYDKIGNILTSGALDADAPTALCRWLRGVDGSGFALVTCTPVPPSTWNIHIS